MNRQPILKEDEGLVLGRIVRFTERGMELDTDDVFGETSLTPYPALKLYAVWEYSSPRKKPEEARYLLLPQDELAPLDARTEALLLRQGVKETDKRIPARAGKLLETFRLPMRNSQKVWAIVLACLGAVLLAILIGLGAWASRMEGFSLPVWGSLFAAVLCLWALACAVQLKRDTAKVYEGGIWVHFTGRGGFFVPAEALEKIDKTEDIAVLYTGYRYYFLPDTGLYACLKERFPEKCGGGQCGN